jgi:transposase InsO family protein
VSRFEFVADHRGAFGVKRLRTVLNVSRSGFYRWLKTAPARAAEQAADAALTRRIREVHAESGKTYGAKRIAAGLRAGGVVVDRKRVERLMRQHAAQGRKLKRRHRTTIPDPAAQAVPDLLRRNFTASAPNRAWVGDITCLPIAGGKFLYLATVIDVYSRRLRGWSMADHMRAELVTDALKAAVRTRGGRVDDGIFHSDHGAQGGFNRSSQHPDLGGVRRRLPPGRDPPVHGSGRHLGGQRRRGVVLRLAQAGDPTRPAQLADRNQPPGSQSSAGSASTTTDAGTPRSATSRRSPSSRDQLRWPSPHDNRCPRPRWKPRRAPTPPRTTPPSVTNQKIIPPGQST